MFVLFSLIVVVFSDSLNSTNSLRALASFSSKSNSSSQDKPCLRLRFKQYDDNPKTNHYMLEFYQQLNHLYPSFVIRLDLNESKEKLNVHVTEYANYEIELSNDEIIQYIKDLIGV